MLGAGFIANYHLDGMAASGRADVRVIASRHGESARRLAEQYRVPDAVDDWRRVLDRQDVQAVVIATPDHTHEEIAIAAAAAGKHVLLQKPMASSLPACKRIATAAQAAGIDLQVSFMHRHFEEVEAARALLAEGAVGRLHSVRIRNATPGPDWEDWFFDDDDVSQGVVHQLGVHGIDLVSWLLGPIENVSARTAIQVATRRLRDGRVIPVGVPDTAFASYCFQSGLVGVHEMSMVEVQGCDRFRLELYGDSGTLWLRTERGRLALWVPQRHGATWRTPDLGNAPLGQRHHRAWLDGLLGLVPRGSTVAEAMTGMRVIEAIAQSASRAGMQVPVLQVAAAAGSEVRHG